MDGDFPILVSALRKTGTFDKLRCSFIDSMSVFRKLCPKQSLRQVDLVALLLHEAYEAHNAIADVTGLGKLLKFVNLTADKLMEHSFTPMAASNTLDFKKAKIENLATLDPLIHSGVIKRPTAENIAGSGLNLGNLKILHRPGGEDEIRDVFTSKNSEGLPRITICKKIIEETVPKMSLYFDN